MGYFDGIGDAQFKKTEEGKYIFSPYGRFFKGYKLTEEKMEEVKKFYIRIMKATFAFIFIGLMVKRDNYYTYFAIALMPLVYYYIKIRVILNGETDYTKEKIGHKDRIHNMSHSMGLTTMILLLIASIVMTSLSTWVLVEVEIEFIGICGVLLFGFATLQFIYMIFLNLKKKKNLKNQI